MNILQSGESEEKSTQQPVAEALPSPFSPFVNVLKSS